MFGRENFDNLRELFVHELKDLYDAESRFLENAGDMKDAATSQSVVEVLAKAAASTEGQKGKLEKVFNLLDTKCERETCPAMKGILDEASHMVKAKGDNATRDAAILASVNRIQHYEIAGYGTLLAFAKTLQLGNEIEDLLVHNLEAGYDVDHMVSLLAEQEVNATAAA